MSPVPSACPRPNAGYVLPMLLWLAACALNAAPKPADGDDTHGAPTGADTAVDSGEVDEGGESADTAHSGETGDTADTGDSADTSDSPAPCSGTSAILTIDSLGTVASPYATLLVADLDGGGAPDVLHESWAGGRGVAFVRGEDIAAGSTVPTEVWLERLESAQAAFAVGPAGDLDGDGVGEVLLGQGESGGPDARLDVWSPAWRPPLGALVVGNLDTSALLFPAKTPAPDLEGDSLPEVVVAFAATAGEESDTAWA